MRSRPEVGVIIVAAGRGTRFGGELPKQYQLLNGIPVLLHALRPFLVHPDVGSVVIVLPAHDATSPPAWLQPFVGERALLVAGGGERRDSVLAGLAALPPCDIVLIHDGARPFPSAAMIDGGIAVARHGRTGVPALPIPDTIKRADGFGRVLGTVDRHGLWCAQTPQAFPRHVLERAHAAARDEEFVATDDAMLVERLGEYVELLPGSARNLKITTSNDLALAAWYAERP